MPHLMAELADKDAEIKRLRLALEEIAWGCEMAAHPAAKLCLSESHVDSLRQVSAHALAALSST